MFAAPIVRRPTGTAGHTPCRVVATNVLESAEIIVPREMIQILTMMLILPMSWKASTIEK